ncbi:hypothetical protein [Nocardioides sp. LHG3406-4]|uniref:hypothetical protein n=1 Tax=Nocardioides sp. LHG3406-4 TaxID=2804575 RepID=UPI003CEC73AC
MIRSLTRQLEPEWDETSRLEAEALARYRTEVHSDGCGLHPAILDRSDVYKFEYVEEKCPACASRDKYRRMLAERDKKDAEVSKDMPARSPRRSDGRRILLRPVGADDATTPRNAAVADAPSSGPAKKSPARARMTKKKGG